MLSVTELLYISFHSTRKSRKGKDKSADEAVTNVVEFIAPPSLAFGTAPNETIYFEIEFRGVGSETFDMTALQDIHIGVHGTPGHNKAWTVTWSGGTSENRFLYSY